MPACPTCGKDNPEGFSFCGFCSASMSKGPSVPDVEERKFVTVFFCDLVGFTARSERADPEDVRAMLRPYHGMLRREIERMGGTVEKFVGDAVMAVFGAPVIHEDDAERAVRSGLRILEAIGELNESGRLELSVRIGINSGEAVVSLNASPERGEGFVTGDVVNTASRLQGVAPVGGIAVGEATFQATSHLFRFEELEPVVLKGKVEPIPIWQPLEPVSRFGVEADLRPTRPLIGRELEVELLHGLLDRSLKESSVQLVTIVGEPGVGKSRLVSELGTYVDAREELIFWRQGRCLPYGDGITFWALGEVVKAQAGILESDPPEVARSKLEGSVISLVPESEHPWLAARLAALVGIESSSTAERDESFTAWRRYLEAIAARDPLVVVFDDLHWADLAMLQFLEHLVDWAEGVPMLVVCTARPELYERAMGWSGGKRNATTINLSRLSDEETARLIAGLLERAVLPADTQALLLERAGGNPLYAEEFVRMLRDRSLLDDRGRMASSDDIPFPDTVHALIAARLDTLTPERKGLLQDAAVVGKVFWSGALVAMGDRSERDLREALHELSKKELVRGARVSSVSGESEYVFWHALVRDVAYGSIPRASRAAKHIAAAGWVEEVAGERVEDLADILAHHLREALELARAVADGTETTGLEERARGFLEMAGDRAMSLDVRKAHDHFRRALEITAPNSPGRPQLLAKIGRAALQTGRPADAGRFLLEAAEVLHADGDVVSAAKTLLDASNALVITSGRGREREALLRAIGLLESVPETLELVLAYGEMAHSLWVSGEASEVRAWSEKAMSLGVKLGASAETARALEASGGARFELGDLSGIEEMRHALRILTENGSVRDTIISYFNLAGMVARIDGPAAALELLREAGNLADRRGGGTEELLSQRIVFLYELGRWDELEAEARQLIVWAEAQGSVIDRIFGRVNLIRVLLNRGEPAAAASLGHGLLAEAREMTPSVLMFSLSAAGALERALGNRDKVRDILQEQARVLAPIERQEQLPDIARLAAFCGDLSVLHELVGSSFERTEPDRCASGSARAILAEATGSSEEAAAMYEKLSERWAAIHVPFEQAHALLGAGRCLVALGETDRAGHSLRKARQIFAKLRAQPLVQETDALLSRAISQSAEAQPRRSG
jgi:class 3 adenylate cyclase/tetratricopeptide (TPR) repeat protein